MANISQTDQASDERKTALSTTIRHKKTPKTHVTDASEANEESIETKYRTSVHEPDRI